MSHESISTAPGSDAAGADEADAFAREAEEGQVGFFREFVDFLRYEKKWWLTPIVIVLLLVGVLVVLGGTPLAPFIYTMW